MVSDLSSINRMSLNEGTIESILSNANASTNNYAFFISSDEAYSIDNGILYN